MAASKAATSGSIFALPATCLVISTALPSLQSLDVGAWCVQVPVATQRAWTETLRSFRYESVKGEAARVWAGRHTWGQRAEALRRALQ